MKILAKIIALDLDDTLLKEDLTISDYTVEILQRAAQKGIYITLCSGRTENAILPFVRRLDIAGKEMGRFIIGQNGSSIMDLHTRLPIFERFVDPNVLITANRMATEENLYSEVYDASTIYVPEANEWTEIDVKLSGLKMEVVEHYEEFLKKGHPKMVIPGDPAHLQEFQKKLQKVLGDSCVIFISKPYFLEIMPKGAGKGEALLWLANKLGIPEEMVMSFGDSMNDESMIRLAGQSVAMCNGLEYIRNIATYVTDKSNNQDGVADFIEKFVL